MTEVPSIDTKELLRKLGIVGAACPVCGSFWEHWKVDERYIDVIDASGTEALTRANIEGEIRCHLFLVLVTCRCSHAMIFNLTDAVAKARAEHLEEIANAGKRGSAAGTVLQSILKEKAK